MNVNEDDLDKFVISIIVSRSAGMAAFGRGETVDSCPLEGRLGDEWQRGWNMAEYDEKMTKIDAATRPDFERIKVDCSIYY